MSSEQLTTEPEQRARECLLGGLCMRERPPPEQPALLNSDTYRSLPQRQRLIPQPWPALPKAGEALPGSGTQPQTAKRQRCCATRLIHLGEQTASARIRMRDERSHFQQPKSRNTRGFQNGHGQCVLFFFKVFYNVL